MEFTTLTRRVAEKGEIDVEHVEPEERLRAGVYNGKGVRPASGGATAAAEGSVKDFLQAAEAPATAAPVGGGMTPAGLAALRKAEAEKTAIDTAAYTTLLSLDQLDQWLAEARDQGYVAFDTETDSLDAMQANLVGFSLALAPGKAAYAPLLHRGEGSGDLFGGADLVPGQMPADAALKRLKLLLEDAAVLKIAQNAKFDMLVMRQHGIEIRNIDDTMLISYALDGGLNASHGMDSLSLRWLGHRPISYDQVTGTGKARVTFDRVPLDRATAYAAEDADVTLRLWRALKPRLAAEGMTTVYETLERPLVDVLMRMERHGVAIDRQILSRLSGEFAQRMAGLEDEIKGLVGEPLNLGSPKQLGDVLFGKMGLPGGRKTPTGQWATDAKLLEDLAAQGHDLPRRILDWRQLSKLKSTYTDALPGFVNPQTNRVHTSFALAATSTGRLSSSDPNLQNIPIRNDQGRKIRTAFVAEPGNKLISADYSQIELRLLAHIADIPQLKQAFADGLDIHAMTASEMFGVPIRACRPKCAGGRRRSISASSMASRLSASRRSSASAGTRPAPISAPISSASPAFATISRRRRRRCIATASSRRSSAASAISA